MKKLVPNLLMMLLLLFSCSKDSTTESSSSNSLTAAVEEKNAENASNINTKKALSASVTYRRDVFSDGTPVPRLVGFNWADEDDNFQRRPLVLSGMSMVYDNGYKLTQSKKEIYDMAKKLYMKYIEVGANTVRIPINHKTTRQSNDVEREYFDKYIQIIRAAVDIPNFHVIISYWPDGKNAGIPKGTIFQPYWKETWEPIVAIIRIIRKSILNPLMNLGVIEMIKLKSITKVGYQCTVFTMLLSNIVLFLVAQESLRMFNL